jgi:hypothetical protein
LKFEEDVSGGVRRCDKTVCVRTEGRVNEFSRNDGYTYQLRFDNLGTFFGGRPICQISDAITGFGVCLVLGDCG